MGKVEKLVVLSVLFIISVVPVASLSTGGSPNEVLAKGDGERAQTRTDLDAGADPARPRPPPPTTQPAPRAHPHAPDDAPRADVPAEVVDKERAIAEETTRAEGQPEKAIPKIVEGRLSGFFTENGLVDQAFAKDPKTTVGKVVEATGGELTGFVRFRVGA